MTQEQFEIYWQRGVDNKVEYSTKHHATVYHRNMQSRYTRDKIQHLEMNITSQYKKRDIIKLRGCVDPYGTAGYGY